MKVTNEIESTGFKVIGLSVEENKKFWRFETWMNTLWFRLINVNLGVMIVLFHLPMFMIAFDVNLWVYVLFQTINVAHNAFFLMTFLHR